jgi:hypothetical protein
VPGAELRGQARARFVLVGPWPRSALSTVMTDARCRVLGHIWGTDQRCPPVSTGPSGQANDLVDGRLRPRAAGRGIGRLTLLRQRFETDPGRCGSALHPAPSRYTDKHC